MAMSEQEMQMQIEIAKARAKAKANQNAQLQAEVEAKGPVNTSGSPDDRQVASDEKAANSYQPGLEATLGHNTVLEAKGLAKGVAKAGIGALQTATAVGSSIGSGLGKAWDAVVPESMQRDPARVQAGVDANNRQIKALQDITPEETTEADKTMMPIGQIGATVAAGGGVGKAIQSVATPVVGKVAGYLAGGLAGGATAAASMPENEGLVVKHDGWIGFGINPDDDPATQQTKKFLNQSIDNMALGVAGEGAFALGKKGVEVVNNFRKYFQDWNNLPAIQQQAGEDVISVYGQLGEHPTAEQQKKAAKEVIDLIDKHGEEAFDFGAAGKKTVKKDTVSTLNAGLDQADPAQRARATELEALRASAKRGNAPKTAVALEQPEDVLNQGLQDSQAVRGGDAAIDQTRKSLQGEAQAAAAEADVPVQMARDKLAQQSTDYTDIMRKDPDIGPMIVNAENGSLDVHKTGLAIKSKIVQKAEEKLRIDKDVRNLAYKAVADTGAPAKMDEFTAVFNEVKDGLPPEIQKIAAGADGTYGYLYNQLRPKLSQAIGNAYKTGSDASALMALKRHIDVDQIAWLTEQGNEQTVQAAKKAAAANAKYSQTWNDTIGKDLRVNADMNRRFTPGTANEQGRSIVDRAISDPNKVESVDNLRGILGKDEGLIGDASLAKATMDITKGKGANIDAVKSELQDMAKNFGPQQKARLEGMIKDFEARGKSIEDLKKQIPQLEAESQAAKDKIFDERFPNLFENVSGKKIPKGNGYDVFDTVLKDQQPRKIEALIEEAKKYPGDIAGLETSWLKSAEDRMSKNPKSIGKLDDQFISYGKKIFGDDSPEIKAITSLRDYTAKLEASLTKPGTEGFSPTKNQKNFRTVISTVETFLFGVLNPTRARIDKITSNIAENYNSTSVSHGAIDTILADNQALKAAAQKMIQKAGNKLSPETWRQLRIAGARLGLYDLKEATGMGNEKKLNTQTNDAMYPSKEAGGSVPGKKSPLELTVTKHK